MAVSLPASDQPFLAGELAWLFGTEVAWFVGIVIVVAILMLACWRRPFALLVRWPCWVIARYLYSMRVLGSQNLPAQGPALICSKFEVSSF